MTDPRTVQAFARAAVPDMREGYTLMVHAEDCPFNEHEDESSCRCFPVRVEPNDPRPMADILASIQRAQRWH